MKECTMRKRLMRHFPNAQTEVQCPYGRVDIVTDDTIYEVKSGILTPTRLFEAIGQLSMYGLHYYGYRKVIVFDFYSSVPKNISALSAMGIEAWTIDDASVIRFVL